MHEPYFERLRTHLAEQGISARYIERLIAELEDHCADAAAERPGRAPVSTTREWLRDRLGHEATIASEVLARPALRGRFCGFRASLRLLLARGVGDELQHGVIAEYAFMRWSASIACGAMITAALLLVMAQSVTLAA